jgi:hypothetical protein
MNGRPPPSLSPVTCAMIAVWLAACGADERPDPDLGLDVMPREGRSASLFGLVVPAGEGGDFPHPLKAAATIRPTPLFEDKNSSRDRRWIVGDLIVAQSAQPEIVVSGLFEAAIDEFIWVSPACYGLKDVPPPPPPPLPPKIAPDLRAALDSNPDTPVRVIVWAISQEFGIQGELDRRIAMGDVAARRDWDEWRDILIAQQQDRIAAELRGLVQFIEDRDDDVLKACKNMPCLIAHAMPDTVRELANRRDVTYLDSADGDVEPHALDGVAVRDGAQIRQFLDNGFDGQGFDKSSEHDNIVFGMLESAGFLTVGHGGFLDDAPPSHFRWALDTKEPYPGRWLCGLEGCDSVEYPPSSAGDHATVVAGLLLGDLTQGQEPSIPAAAWEGGSGYAPRALLHSFSFGSVGQAVHAFDRIAGFEWQNHPPHILNSSWGDENAAQITCQGNHSVSKAANRAFQAGHFGVVSAGNSYGSANNCRVTAPADAIGSFAVGGHLNLPENLSGSAVTVRSGPIYEPSSWGGNPTQGQNRSIVSLTAPAIRENLFDINGGIDHNSSHGTSWAAPTVASVAGLVLDWYRQSVSYFVYFNPGLLYTQMLLMGDRQNAQGGKNTAGFDHRWGAGRLRARLFQSDGMSPRGMSAPWLHFTSWTCVDDGQLYKVEVLSGETLSSEYDDFKAAAYWYDQRHDTTGEIADVDLILHGVGEGPLEKDCDSFDNKAFVYAPDVGGKQLELHLHGANVKGHWDPICGNDSILVHFAAFAESGKRNGQNRPPYNAGQGRGVAPESQ